MVILQAQETQQRVATVARLLLRRRGAVYPPAPGEANPMAEAGVRLLEADLLDRGWLLSPALRDALLRVETAELASVGSTLVADCDALLGADRRHVPLFRRFPDAVPADTAKFFVERILAHWFRAEAQPCVLCNLDKTVTPVNPCGHLVCQFCFDPADFSACPICHGQLDPADPYLRRGELSFPVADRRRVRVEGEPRRLRVLHLGIDVDADSRDELAALLARPTALPPADVDDVQVLLSAQDRACLGWLPAVIPGRETKARVLAWLLADQTVPGVLEAASARIDTATDVLRLLVVLSGGDTLVDRPRIGRISRPLRRALLAILDGMSAPRLVEDMRRHRRAWIAVGERLHVGEYGARYPAAALAFAAIRRTDLLTRTYGETLTCWAGAIGDVWVRDGRVVVASRGRRVEEALVACDVTAAMLALRSRPGELLRRLDHLLRLAVAASSQRAGGDISTQEAAVLGGVVEAAREVSPAVLLSALGQLRTRAVRRERRVFWPAGRTSTAHIVGDARPALPEALVDAVTEVLTAEVLRRAGTLSPVDRAVVDVDLAGVVVPFAERTASRSLVTLARGTALPVPDGRTLRLFLHWMESERWVDLDLSVAVYDSDWKHVGTCDYTNLRLSGATHSGDSTSAPAPRGASEFIDLDLRQLAGTGARWAVMSVLSFNDVPFTDMAEAFAGFMIRDDVHGQVFDARTVEQRFDLTGPGKVTVPFVVDLERRTMRWLDVSAHVTGTNHAVHRHGSQLGLLAQALTESFEAGARVTIGQLGIWIAAARAREVLVRDDSGIVAYRRRDGETVAAFADRVGGLEVDGEATVSDASEAALQFVARGDLPGPAGAEVYALHPARLDASSVRLLAAADVPGLLVVARD